jgi:hypothetical protein
MLHPIDIAPKQDEDHPTPPGGRGSGIWAVIGLVAIVALIVAATIAVSDGGGEQQQTPPPVDAPLDPGTGQ